MSFIIKNAAGKRYGERGFGLGKPARWETRAAAYAKAAVLGGDCRVVRVRYVTRAPIVWHKCAQGKYTANGVRVARTKERVYVWNPRNYNAGPLTPDTARRVVREWFAGAGVSVRLEHCLPNGW